MLQVTDSEGVVRFVFDAPFMFDDAEVPDFSTDLDVTLDQQGEGWVLSWTATDAWLDDEARVWPVTIDPTVTIDGADAESCWFSDPSWYACTVDTDLRAGDFNGRQARSLVRFDLEDAIGEPAQVRRAHVQLEDASSTGTPVAVHQATTDWMRGEVSWTDASSGTPWDTPGGDFDSDALSHSDGSLSAGYRFQVPGVVQDWVDGDAANHGLLLKAVDESDPAVRWDAGVSLVVDWTPLVGMHQHATLHAEELDDRRGLHVDVVSGNLMLTDTDVQIAGTAGADLALTRTYNHLLADETSWETPAGWTSPSRRRPYDLSWEGEQAIYRDPDSGFAVVFLEQDDGTWEPTSRIDAKLEQDPGGSDFTLTWNTSGEVYHYHAWGGIDAVEDRSGNRIQYYYDASYRVSSIEDTQGRVTTFDYGPGNQVETMTDPVGRTHTYTYDPADEDRLLEVEDPAGNTFSYDETSTPDHVQVLTDTRGNQTRITYESGVQFARVVEIVRITDTTAGTGPTTSFAYDDDETVVTDPNGHDTTYQYDQAGKVDTVIDALGNERSSGFDPNGNVETYTSARGSATGSTYDQDTNNLREVERPTGSGEMLTESYDYDDPNNEYAPSKSINTQRETLEYGYDGAGRLDSMVTDPGGPDEGHYDMVYNNDGTLKSSTDPNGNETTFSYDNDGNLKGTTPEAPLGATSRDVDGLSRVTSMTDGEGQTVTYGYDIMDRVVSVTYPDLMVTYSYDEAGNLTGQTDATGTSTFQPDELNRLESESRPGAGTTSYSYDPVGNLTGYTDATGTVTYGYDDVNRLTSLEEPPLYGLHETTFDYDEDGNRIETVYPNGVTQTFDIDDADRLLEIEATRGSTALTRFTYTYTRQGEDDNGDPIEFETALREQVTDVDGITTDYTYDTQSRLTGADRDDNGTTLDEWGYTYDKASNRTGATHNGITTHYTYNDANQLTSELTGNSTTNFTYDDNGNLTGSDKIAPLSTGSSGDLSLSYNSANQTTQIDTGSDLVDFDYAGDTQVERTNVGGTALRNSALGVSRAGSTGYIRDDAGSLVSMRNGAQRYYYLFDGLGSVVGLTDTTGQLVNTYEYDPYGNELDFNEQVDNPWRYTGEWYDDTTGLYKIGHRYYNPDQGRWTQPDPSGADANLYTYVGANPINNVDPTGLAAGLGCFAGTVGVGIAVKVEFCASLGSGGWDGSLDVNAGMGLALDAGFELGGTSANSVCDFPGETASISGSAMFSGTVSFSEEHISLTVGGGPGGGFSITFPVANLWSSC